MRSRLFRWLAPPTFNDEEKTRVANLLNLLLLSLIFLTLLDTILLLIFAPETIPTMWINGVFFLLMASLFLLMRRGFVQLSSILLCLLFWLLTTYYVSISGGLRSPAFTLLWFLAVIPTVLLGMPGTIGFGSLCVVTTIGMYWADNVGLLVSEEGPPTLARLLATDLTVLIGITLLMAVSGRSVLDALARARSSARSLDERNRELQNESEDRQRAQQAQKRLVDILETTTDLVGISDITGNSILYLNRAGRKMMGFSEIDDLSALRIADFYPPDISEMLLKQAIPAAVRDGTWSGETILRANEGHEIAVSQVIIVHRDPAGDVEFISTVMRDVSERKQAEQALRASELKFRRFVEESSEGIVLTDERGIITEWNRSQEQITGVPQAQVLGQPLWDIQYSLSLVSHQTSPTVAQLKDMLRDFLRTGLAPWALQTVENRIKRVDGSVRLVQSIIFSIPTDKGFIAASVLNDITERKRTEEALWDSEGRYRTLIEQASDGIFVANSKGEYVEVNAAGCQMLGYTREEILQKTMQDLAKIGPDRPLRPEELRRRKTLLSEREMIRKDGTLVTVEISAKLLADGSFQGIVRDITERKRMEQILITERNQLRTLIDNLPDYVFIKDTEGRFVVSNAAHAHAVQLEPPMLIGRTALEVFGPDLAPVYDADDQSVLHTGQALINVERTTTDSSGNKVNVLTTKVPLKDQTGQIVGLVGISRDVTDRKRAEEALRQSEVAEHEQRILAETLRDTAEALVATLEPDKVMVHILNNVGRVVPHDCSSIWLIEGESARAAYTRCWSPEEEAVVKTIRLPLDILGVRDLLAGSPTFLISDTTTDPVWRNITTHATSVVGAAIRVHGQVIGFLDLKSAQLGFFTAQHAERLEAFANQAAIALEKAELYDELRRLAAELGRRVEQRTAELHAAKEHLETVFNSSTDAIAIVGRDGLIRETNPSFFDLLGYQYSHDLGQSIVALAAPGSVEPLTEALSAVIGEAKPMQIELVAQNQDGTQFDAELVLSPIIGPDNQAEEIICNVRDITPRKQVEIALRQTAQKERELGELRSRFLSMASHDFRTPLTVILAAADLLELHSDQLTAELRLKYLNNIHVGVSRMTELLDDILTFNQGEEGRLEFKPTLIDLQVLCREMVEYAQTADGKAHDFVFSSKGHCSNAFVDERLLRQILVNLLSNAAKYSPKGTAVTFDLSCEPGQAVLVVKDHGIGIPEKDLTGLFEPFHRAANARSVRGTGLGLAIVKRAIDLHGGTIHFESQVGIGTAFTVVIPTFQEAQQ